LDYNRAHRLVNQRSVDMRLARPLVASLLIVGLSTASFAGELRDSIAKAAEQQAEVSPPKIDPAYMIPGAALFVAGMSMAVYGFLHTSGGEFVSGQVSKESKTGLGGAGLAVAGAGGAILFFGAHRAKHAPSVMFGPKGVTVTKRLSW
jgi:hypothetical protein